MLPYFKRVTSNRLNDCLLVLVGVTASRTTAGGASHKQAAVCLFVNLLLSAYECASRDSSVRLPDRPSACPFVLLTDRPSVGQFLSVRPYTAVRSSVRSSVIHPHVIPSVLSVYPSVRAFLRTFVRWSVGASVCHSAFVCRSVRLSRCVRL